MSSTFVSPAVEPEWAALVAIDWADKKHAFRLLPAGSVRSEQGEIENRPEAVEVWASQLAQRFEGRPIAVCLEQSRGALIYMLTKYSHLYLFPVPPAMAAGYRKTFATSGAKSDPGDTSMLLDLLLRHRDRLRQLQPDTKETRLLHVLVEERRKLVDERTRQSNRLTDCLKCYFPQILYWFDDVTSPLVRGFLSQWPLLENVQRAHPGTLRKFFKAHNCRSQERIEQRIEEIYQARPATDDEVVLEFHVLRTQGLLALLEPLEAQIKILDRRIAELTAAHPEAAVFGSFPGAGKALTPRLIAAFGTDRTRFQDADDMQRLSGIAPVKESSGNSEWTHFRFVCPTFLRQTFHEYARCSIAKSAWAKTFYDHLTKDEKKDHHAAVRALAFKWIRIMFRCWKDGKPYDEKFYLQQLRRRSLRVGWQQIAGFHKLVAKSA